MQGKFMSFVRKEDLDVAAAKGRKWSPRGVRAEGPLLRIWGMEFEANIIEHGSLAGAATTGVSDTVKCPRR